MAPLEAASLAQSNAALAFELLGQFSKQPGNFVYSPFSASTSLALASAGASGPTLEEFQRVLHWSGEPAALHPAVSTLQWQIAAGTAQSGCELHAAYGLWTPKSLPVTNEFRALAQKTYEGAWQTADFAHPESAARAVNSWIELHTAFKIKELVKPDDVGMQTGLMLASAMYFKGLWAKTFPRSSSTYDSFNAAGGVKVPVTFMRQSARHRLAEGDGWQMLELAFAGGALAMLVMLPRATDGLRAFESSLSLEFFERMRNDLQPQSVIVSLPRFRISSNWDLRESLTALGLQRAFQVHEADFSHLHAHDPLALSSVMQRCAIDVTEEGAEVSKDTGVAGKSPSEAKTANDPRVFAADRPFLWAVRDSTSGVLLLMGRVEKL
jgi:serpin B